MSGESNQVLWRGVRPVEGIRGVWPARNSVRIIKEAIQVGVGSAIAYTVPASKIFFITSAELSCYNSAGGGVETGLGIRDGGDVHLWFLMVHYFEAQSQHSGSHQFFPAIEVLAGYDVYVMSGGANVTSRGLAFGWLEDA